MGGGGSCTEILTALYYELMDVDPMNPEKEDRDHLILSKGHGAPMLYLVLAHKGFFPMAELKNLRQTGSMLQGHPCVHKTSGVELSIGPLGLGLSAGLGMALGARLKGYDSYTYVIMGDGEIFVRSIPNMTVISTADGPETRKAVFAIAEHQGPVYLRLSRAPAPAFYGDDMRFEIGKGIRVREGSDVAIITTGTLLHNAIQAAAILEAEGVRTAVVDMHTVKPIDQNLILECAEQTGAIVTVEEHSIYGGLGSAVAEVLAERCPVPMERVGAVDFAESGDYGQLMEKYGYGPESIALRCRAVMGRRQDNET